MRSSPRTKLELYGALADAWLLLPIFLYGTPDYYIAFPTHNTRRALSWSHLLALHRYSRIAREAKQSSVNKISPLLKPPFTDIDACTSSLPRSVAPAARMPDRLSSLRPRTGLSLRIPKPRIRCHLHTLILSCFVLSTLVTPAFSDPGLRPCILRSLSYRCEESNNW